MVINIKQVENIIKGPMSMLAIKATECISSKCHYDFSVFKNG
jgi:hypothetical protein